MVRQTSIKAYMELRKEGKLGARQMEVLKAFVEHGAATDLEMARKLHYGDANRLRPRRNELVAKGYLEEVGKRKCSVSKRLAYVWSVK